MNVSVKNRLAKIKAKVNSQKNFPSEPDIRFYANHAFSPEFKIPSVMRKLLLVPAKERITLGLVRGSRVPLNRMPIEDLRLLHKHRNLFTNANSIHNAYIKKTTGASPQKIGQELPPEHNRNRLMFVMRSTVPYNKMPIENLALLYKYKHLFPNANSKVINNVVKKATKVDFRSRDPTRLNLGMPHFNLALRSKGINNKNVQKVLEILKSYRATKRPRENNAPTRPVHSGNLKRYKRNLANYDSALRNWMVSTEAMWRRNNPS